MVHRARLPAVVVASALAHAIPIVLLARPAHSRPSPPPPTLEQAVAAELAEEAAADAPPSALAPRGGAPGPGRLSGHPGRHSAPSPEPPRRAASLGLLARDLAQAGPAMTSDAAGAWELATDTRPRFAGGTTQRGGKSTTAVTDPNARLGGAPDGDGDGDGAGGGGGGQRGLRRLASLGGDKQWECPLAFQGENASLSGMVIVHARADVLSDGSAARVIIVDAPTKSFAVAAEACALRERFVPALDENDKPVRGWTRRFRVVFSKY